MDQEPVRLMVCLAILPQILAYRLALFPGIGKDQTFLSPGMFKDIADARIGRLRRGVCGSFRHGRFRHSRLSLIRLGSRIIEMLHGQPPDLFSAVKSRNNGRASAAGRQEAARRFRISYGSREADPSGGCIPPVRRAVRSGRRSAFPGRRAAGNESRR